MCTHAQSCPILCYPLDCSPPDFSVHGILPARIWYGLPCPSPGDRPNPRIEPRSPALQTDSLPAEPPGKLRNAHMVVTQSFPTVCDPMDCSPPGSSVRGILQARIPEWVAIPFFRGSSQLRNQNWVSHTAGRFFTDWAAREAHIVSISIYNSCWRAG